METKEKELKVILGKGAMYCNLLVNSLTNHVKLPLFLRLFSNANSI